MKEEAYIWMVILFVLGFVFFPFWFCICVPCCMASCRRKAQRPVYGYPRQQPPGAQDYPNYIQEGMYRPPEFPPPAFYPPPPPNQPYPPFPVPGVSLQPYPSQPIQGGSQYPYPPQGSQQQQPPQQAPVYQATVITDDVREEPQKITSSAEQQQYQQYNDVANTAEPSAPLLPTGNQV